MACTPLCTAERVAHSPRKRQNEWRARKSERRSDLKGLGPCPRHRIATRARICSTDFYTYACGGLEDSAKIAKYSDEW